MNPVAAVVGVYMSPPPPQPPLKKSKATHDDSHLKDDYLEPPPRLIEEEDLYTSPSAEDREQLLQETTTTTSSSSPSSTTQGHDGTSTLMMSVLPSFSEEEEEFPLKGMSAGDAKQRVMNELNTDFKKPRFNLASYINITTQHEGQDQEEIDLAILGLSVNIAETAAYPFTTSLHEKVVNMIAKLWYCPPPQSSPPSPPSSSSNTPPRTTKYCGTSTIGSTEACLLGGLALKWRWKEWYKTKHGVSDAEVRGIQPNLIISSCYQSTWEKFFRFFDVEPRVIQPNLKYDKLKMMDINKIVELCDEKTIGIVGILGNHYNGAYDPISTINSIITDVNLKYGYQIGIHVDAASGGFVEPFRCCSTNFFNNSNNNHNNNPPLTLYWDFRLENVLSINASGHKFGESSCGIWLDCISIPSRIG